MFGDEAGEKGGVDAPADIVAGRDGEEGAGVVVEADGVVEAGGFGGLLAKAHHAFGGVVEPPGRAEAKGGVVAGEGGELAGVGGLVEGEEDEGEAGVVAVLVEQGVEGADVLRGGRDVGALVGTELPEDGLVVVAYGAGVKLHDEAVVEAHACHFGEHLGLKEGGIFGGGAAGVDAGVEVRGFDGAEVGGEGCAVAVVGGGGAVVLEEGTAVAEGVEVAGPGGGVFAGDLAESGEVLAKVGGVGVDDGVGAEGGEDAAVPAGALDGLVVCERIEGGVGGGEGFDVKAIEEGSWEELRSFEGAVDGVVDFAAVVFGEALADAEEGLEGEVEPEAGGGSAKQVVVTGEDAPDLAGVGSEGGGVPGNAEGFKRDALRVEHAEDVVVGLDKEGGGVGEGLVFCEPSGVGMAVRREDGSVADGFIEAMSELARGVIGGEEAEIVQHEGHLRMAECWRSKGSKEWVCRMACRVWGTQGALRSAALPLSVEMTADRGGAWSRGRVCWRWDGVAEEWRAGFAGLRLWVRVASCFFRVSVCWFWVVWASWAWVRGGRG